MSLRANKPDTQADIDIRSALQSTTPHPFVVTAGAGSGKTTSLIKTLSHIIDNYGGELKHHDQRIACITYTQVAADEIHAEVSNNPLVLVCTIHSFLWTLVRPFQNDIREWVNEKISSEVLEISGKTYSPRTSQATKDKDAKKLADLRAALENIEQVPHFTYGTSSKYSEGILGHEDILSLGSELIQSKPLLAKIISRSYPFILVDESQDTFASVVDALKIVQQTSGSNLKLGFFGDPMQSIYQRGVGQISSDGDWIAIDKPENYRSSKKVLEVINAVRSGGDSLTQTPGRGEADTPEGEVFFIVLPTDDARVENLDKVRHWLEENSANTGWTGPADGRDLKILAIVHRMAARRLGFENLYTAFNDNGSSLSEDFTEGTAWPISPFRDVILPLAESLSVSDPKILSILRKHSPLLREDLNKSGVKETLAVAKEAVDRLRAVVNGDSEGSAGEAIRIVIDTGLIKPDPRYVAFLSESGIYEGVENSDSTKAVLSGLFACKVSEVQSYRKYIEEESPYSTQHGTKGSEFDKVIVILDDDEGTYSLYSFEKYLGIKALSETDVRNAQQGKETVVDRTRRLFYVCVSRAVSSLAVLLFTNNVQAGVDALNASGITASARILTLDDINE